MKKLSAIVLVLALALCVMSPAMAASERIRINNTTGFIVYKLYLSPSYSNSWEEDVLGSTILCSGEYININFPDGIYTRYWDLKIEKTDGSYFYWEDLDLYRYSSVTVYTDRYGYVQAQYDW